MMNLYWQTNAPASDDGSVCSAPDGHWWSGTWCIGAEGSLKVELTSVEYEAGPCEPHTRDIALAVLPQLYRQVAVVAAAGDDDDIDID
jgi:hypothetical protein